MPSKGDKTGYNISSRKTYRSSGRQENQSQNVNSDVIRRTPRRSPESSPEPQPRTRSRNTSFNEACSNSEDDHEEETNNQTYKSRRHSDLILPAQQKVRKNNNLIYVILAILLFGTVFGFYIFKSGIKCYMGEAKDNFSSESEDVHITLDSGLNEVISFNKPSVFLYMYKNKPDEEVGELLRHIASFASCKLANNQTTFIELTKFELKNLKVIKNYGALIDHFKPRLEKSKVMLVQNLEEVPGVVAQVFHSFCDEFNPVVNGAVFLFSLKVDDFKEKDFETAEVELRKRWSDLDDDIFHPLLSRITNMIVRLEN